MPRRITAIPAVSLLLLSLAAAPAAYDPLALRPGPVPQPSDLTVADAARRREIPVRVYLPAADQPAPVLLFSHGLGGNRQGSAFLGAHWAARGYAVVYLQHPGSDDAVWKDAAPGERMAVLRQAASGENLLLRVGDVKAAIDQLEKWNAEKDHPLHGRFDLSRIGMSGHSFGAVTTQAVGGQAAPAGGARLADPRVRAAVAFSPSSPRAGDPAKAFADVKIPWLLLTGTNDTSPIGGQTVESRLAVYPNLPATIDKYELVLKDAEHSAFTDRALPGDRNKRNPNNHRATLALTTAFFDAHLRTDAAARAWLHGDGAKAVLEPGDRWQLHAGGEAKP